MKLKKEGLQAFTFKNTTYYYKNIKIMFFYEFLKACLVFIPLYFMILIFLAIVEY